MSGFSSAQLKRLEETSRIWQEVLASRRSQKALAAIANGEGPHFVGNAPQKNSLGAPAKVAGQHFSVPEELDPANASVLHMAHPRSREVAMLMAEHARWAQRDALKALYLAASDSNQAFEASRRANEAVMQAMRQPNASFPVYAEKPLPMEPWLAAERWPTDPPDPLRTMPLGNSAPGVHLERLAQWFQLHPRPPISKPVDHIDVQPPPELSQGMRNQVANGSGAGTSAPQVSRTVSEVQAWQPHRAPAPVPFLSGRDPYISKPPPPPNRDDDPDPTPDQKTPPSPGLAPPKGGLPPPLAPPASQMCLNDGMIMSSSLLEDALRRRRRRLQRQDDVREFFCAPSTIPVYC